MRTLRFVLSFVAAVALFALPVGLFADEKKVDLAALPAKVVEAVKAKFPTAKVTGAETEKENNETVYEVKLTEDGHKLEATFKADGTLVCVEKEITAADLPKPVAAALTAKYPNATYTTVEEETKDGKVTYEVLLVTADKKKLEVVLDPTGQIIEEEKKDKEEKKD